MTVSDAARPDLHYELRIRGHLDRHWSTWFGGLALIRHDDGTTALRGDVIDQAELYGLLAKVRELGITLISLTSVDDSEPVPKDGNTSTPPRPTRRG